MRKIIAGLFISLDGVIQGPGPGDVFEHAGWSMQYMNDEINQYIGANAMSSDGLLLGRNTYDTFKATFAHQTEPWAMGMNNMQKYVVSNTLQSADWNNTEVIGGNVPEAIAALKQQSGQSITISGSGTLVQTLAQHDLIDEYALITMPIVLGIGMRLFPDGLMKKLSLIEARPLGSQVVLLRYEPATTA